MTDTPKALSAEEEARWRTYAYDVRGRTTHEALFNTNDGAFRAPSSQQGFSPFTTWTRGLAWALCGFAEQLEFMRSLGDHELEGEMLKAAAATGDFYLDHATASDGIPYWDTGAPNLHRLKNWPDHPADPFNDWEPVDSSAAAIGAREVEVELKVGVGDGVAREHVDRALGRGIRPG